MQIIPFQYYIFIQMKINFIINEKINLVKKKKSINKYITGTLRKYQLIGNNIIKL